MALTNTRALCLLSDVEDDLGITDSSSSAALERRILVASALIEAHLGRRLRREVGRVEALAGYGTTRLLPTLTPIESVSEVSYLGQVLAADSYEVQADSTGEGWCIYSPSGWAWTAPGVQGIDYSPRPLPGQERSAYRVTYTGGYALPNDSSQLGAALPPPIREAAIALAVHLWRRRGADTLLVSETAGNASATRKPVGADEVSHGVPPEIASMLDGYRRAA